MTTTKFCPVPSDRLAGKLRKYHSQITWLFYITIVTFLGLTIYGIINPGTVFYLGFYYHLIIFSLFLLTFYKPPLPHNYKKDDSKELYYQFEEDALIVSFYNKEVLRIAYTTIVDVQPLQERLKGIKSIHAVGRHYWVTFGEVVGVSKEYPALFVYSTSITEGVLISRKYEKVLLSPENQEEFLKELKNRIDSHTNCKLHHGG